MKYKHLFFDLDHTLWDFDANAKLALIDLYQAFKLETKGVIPFETFYQHYLHHNEILWARYHNGFITSEDLKWKRMWRTLLEFKIGDESLARSMGVSFLEILPTKTQLFPYTIELLNYLLSKNYTLHLITNGFEKTQWSKLNNSGLNAYFSHVITSEASNSLKPKKEIFEYAFMKAGALPEESIMIGDNQDADIQGAVNAGIDNVFVNHIKAESKLNPTFIVTHLQQLTEIL